MRAPTSQSEPSLQASESPKHPLTSSNSRTGQGAGALAGSDHAKSSQPRTSVQSLGSLTAPSSDGLPMHGMTPTPEPSRFKAQLDLCKTVFQVPIVKIVLSPAGEGEGGPLVAAVGGGGPGGGSH